MSDPNYDLLPPALRMAAQQRRRNTTTTTSTTSSGNSGNSGSGSTMTGRASVPSIRMMIPSKTKSFQLRKDQTDALAKIRCQPREDIMTEDERRKRTLLRRSTLKQKRDAEMQEAQRLAQSKAIMDTVAGGGGGGGGSGGNDEDEDEEDISAMVQDTQNTGMPPPPPSAPYSATSPKIAMGSNHNKNKVGGAGAVDPARMSWQRSSPSMTPRTAAQRTSALQQQAQAMRAKVKALTLDDDDDDDDDDGNAPGGAAAAANSKSNDNDNDNKPKQHTLEIVQKKLEKVERLLAKETPGTKDYKKLSKKREQYQDELEDFQQQHQKQQQQKQQQQQQQRKRDEKAAALAKAQAEADHAERLAQQAVIEEDEQRAAAAAAMEAKRKAAQQQESSAMAEEARLLKERAEAIKAKRSAPPSPDEDDDDEEEEEMEEESASASEEEEDDDDEEEEEDEEAEEEVVVDEKERIRQQRIEEYRRKVAQKKEEEEAAKRKAERIKEFKILKKKLQKLEGMIDDAEQKGGKDHNTAKYVKKKHEYISQLEEFDEWQEELEARRKAAEAEQARKEREEAERQRKEALEQERRRQAEEEAERRRKEAEEARRELEQLERERKEEEARLRIERLEEAHREKEEAEARRIEEEKRAAREAEEAQNRAAREAEEEQERTAREAEEAEARAAREAEESQERAAREAEMALQRAEQEKIDAERRQREEEEQAQRREELREQTRSAESQATSEEPAATTKAEASQEFLDLRNIPEPHSANTKKILSEIESVEDRQSRLEKTLKQNGIAVCEDIPYEVAKDKIAELQEQMKALAVSEEDQFVVQKKYYSLEEELSKYVTAMMLTDEFAEEQRLAEEKWEASIEVDNITALRKVRNHMPVNIRNMTEDQLTSDPTPNGKMLPKALAKKFKRTNVLQLIRVDPHDLERMHPSLIEGLRSTGLTLTERRALHEHLKEVGAMWHDMQQDPSIERKYSWFLGLKSKFKEMVTAYDKHVQEYGPPSNHPYSKRNDPQGGGCPMIGNQCPVKADAATSYDDDFGFTQEAEYEGSANAGSGSGGAPSRSKSFIAKTKARVNTGGAKDKDDALMADIRERLNLIEAESAIDSKLLRELFFAEKRAASLEKQLTQNGLSLPKEDISFAVAKAKVAEITEEIKVIASKMGSISDMKEMARLEKEYSQLSDDLEKYNNALMLTKEWAMELLEKERQWEERVRPDNQEALRTIRRHMPVNIKDLSEQDLIQGTTPNGKQLPQKIVRKFKRTNILQLVRMPPSMIEPMHPSSLEGMRSTGLTLTERRALHEHLKDLGVKWKAASNDKMSERKWMWHESLRGKFRELVDKWQKHVDEYGPPGNHPYAKARGEPGCPLIGKQCPLKGDLDVDYSEDYGFPAEDVYNVEKVKKSNLLTVEDLERRKQDDDWGYDTPAQQEEETSQPPMAGLMAAIGARGGGAAGGGAGAGDDARPKMGGGLIAAISKGGGSGNDADTTIKKPPAPKLGGGLLAAISAKGGGDDGDVPTGSNKPPAPGGLLAAIQTRGRDTSSPAAATAAPAPSPTAPVSVSPTKKKRMGGLLSSITSRGKK